MLTASGADIDDACCGEILTLGPKRVQGQVPVQFQTLLLLPSEYHMNIELYKMTDKSYVIYTHYTYINIFILYSHYIMSRGPRLPNLLANVRWHASGSGAKPGRLTSGPEVQ